MKLQVCAKTDIGLSRKNNEDRYFVDRQRNLFIVADGMGGHAAGEIASQIAVETVSQSLQTIAQDNPQKQLRQAIEKANQAVAQAAKHNRAWQGMGTTLTLLLLHQQQALLAHVGDSRAYRLRNKQLMQLSDDHSLTGEQLRQGILSAEEARYSDLGNILLQAIGVSAELDICLKHFPLVAGDRFLLCSDGLTDMLLDTDIEPTLQSTKTLDNLCDELVAKAITAGGKDNITVIVLQIDEF